MPSYTSPLVEIANMNCVFVRTSNDWFTFGEQQWAAMAHALYAAPPGQRLIGIDSEWFFNSPLSVVQVASRTHCFVFHLPQMSGRLLPPAVHDVLADGTVIKCGVGVSSDVQRLQNEQHITVRTVMDVDTFSVLLNMSEPGKTGLAALAKVVCNVVMEKSKAITRSNWELELSHRQVAYAADDAVASYLIGREILRKVECTPQLSLASEFDVEKWSVHAAVAVRRESSGRNRMLKAGTRPRILTETTSAAAGNSTNKSTSTADERQNCDKEKQIKVQSVDSPSLPAAKPKPAVRAKNTEEPFYQVAVLNPEGQQIASCSLARAFLHCTDEAVATITQYRSGESSYPLAIKLTSVPEDQWRSRLCVYARIGQCELGEHCPRAHSVQQLSPSAAALLTDPTGFACSFCLSTRNLTRFSLVPRILRQYLPAGTGNDDSFVPACGDCARLLAFYLDHATTAFYHQDEYVFKQTKKKTDATIMCICNARILRNAKKMRGPPQAKQLELQRFVYENWLLPWSIIAWRSALVCGAKSINAVSDEAVKQMEAVALACAETGALSAEALTRIANLNSDDVKPFFAMQAYVFQAPSYLAKDWRKDNHGSATLHGSAGSTDATQQIRDFMQHWQMYARSSCGLLQKPHNHWTREEWQQYEQLNSVDLPRISGDASDHSREYACEGS